MPGKRCVYGDGHRSLTARRSARKPAGHRFPGKVLEGPAGAKPSKETSFHLAVYEVRPDVKVIIHVHPTYATSFAVNGRLIPTITISAQLKLKQGKLIAIAPPGSKELRRFRGAERKDFSERFQHLPFGIATECWPSPETSAMRLISPSWLKTPRRSPILRRAQRTPQSAPGQRISGWWTDRAAE